jgi:hypothetical protein
MLQALDDYDWKEAFGYAGEPGTCGEAAIEPVPGAACAATPFARDDVAEIFALIEGENDEKEWIGVLRLNDGRFACLAAGCDYTGWDCQARGRAYVADSLESLARFGMDNDQRRRVLSDEPKVIDPAFREIVRAVEPATI